MASCEWIQSGTETSLKLRGELVVAELARLKAEMLPHLEGTTNVVLDLDDLEAIDGAGVQFLLAFKMSLTARGAVLAVSAKGAKVAAALDLAGATHAVCGA